MFKWIKERIQEYNCKKKKRIVHEISILALQTYQASTLNIFNLLKLSYKKRLLRSVETNKIWSKKKYNKIFKKILIKRGLDHETSIKDLNYELLKGEYTQWCVKNIFLEKEIGLKTPEIKENQKNHTT